MTIISVENDKFYTCENSFSFGELSRFNKEIHEMVETTGDASLKKLKELAEQQYSELSPIVNNRFRGTISKYQTHEANIISALDLASILGKKIDKSEATILAESSTYKDVLSSILELQQQRNKFKVLLPYLDAIIKVIEFLKRNKERVILSSSNYIKIEKLQIRVMRTYKAVLENCKSIIPEIDKKIQEFKTKYENSRRGSIVITALELMKVNEAISNQFAAIKNDFTQLQEVHVKAISESDKLRSDIIDKTQLLKITTEANEALEKNLTELERASTNKTGQQSVQGVSPPVENTPQDNSLVEKDRRSKKRHKSKDYKKHQASKKDTQYPGEAPSSKQKEEDPAPKEKEELFSDKKEVSKPAKPPESDNNSDIGLKEEKAKPCTCIVA